MARELVARSAAPAYSIEGLTHLVQEVDALIAHLARAAPGALEACFMDSRSTGTAPSKVAPPRGSDIAPDTLRGFIERVAGITSRFAAQGQEVALDALMPVADFAYLLEVRSFLAQLVLPASVDTILVTQGYHDGLACLAQRPGLVARVAASLARAMPVLRDRRGGPVSGPGGDGHPSPASVHPVSVHQATESGWRFARLARLLRHFAVFTVIITLTFALYVFSGKTLQEEAQRLNAALGTIQQQIDADIDRSAARSSSGAATSLFEQVRAAGWVFDQTLSYCDQPFLDDTGIIRYARPAQELNCARLWGVNRAVNQNNRQMQAWITPATYPPFSGFFGLFALHAASPDRPARDGERVVRADDGEGLGLASSVREVQSRSTNRVGLLRVFPENARAISPPEAEALAIRRTCESAERTKTEGAGQRSVPPANPGSPVQTGAGERLASTETEVVRQGDSAQATPNASSSPQAPSAGTLLDTRLVGCSQGLRLVTYDELSRERARIFNGATSQFGTLRLALPINDQTEHASPIRVRVVIEGLTLYVLPVLFAMLGAFVSVLREIRRRADAALLTLTEHSRMLTTLVLGVSFGAVVSLLAEIIGSGSNQTATSAASISLGLWPLAFLAGYAVSHVFRMLDAAVDRVFGQRQPTDRPAIREA